MTSTQNKTSCSFGGQDPARDDIPAKNFSGSKPRNRLRTQKSTAVCSQAAVSGVPSVQAGEREQQDPESGNLQNFSLHNWPQGILNSRIVILRVASTVSHQRRTHGGEANRSNQGPLGSATFHDDNCFLAVANATPASYHSDNHDPEAPCLSRTYGIPPGMRFGLWLP